MMSEKASKFYELFRPSTKEIEYRNKEVAMHEGHMKRVHDDSKPGSECECILSVSNQEASTKYSKEDVWVVSSTRDLKRGMVARTDFYGASKGGSFKLSPLSDLDRRISVEICPDLSKFGDELWAIRMFNARTEFMTLDAIETFRNCETAIKPTILDPKGKGVGGLTPLLKDDVGNYEEVLREFEMEYRLNTDQVSVCRNVLESLGSGCKTPITLVHGVFGAGKSFVISVLILLLHRLHREGKLMSSKHNEPFRIVISSNTNGKRCFYVNPLVAVDRILQGLIKLDFKDFVRVGSVKKIAKSILPYTASAHSKSATGEIKELNEMLADSDLTDEERENIIESIARVSKGDKLESFFVIGVTCAACEFEVFDEISCSLLILDEASQMTEPMSLVPITRFVCERALLVGDPLQLQVRDSVPNHSADNYRSEIQTRAWSRMDNV